MTRSDKRRPQHLYMGKILPFPWWSKSLDNSLTFDFSKYNLKWLVLWNAKGRKQCRCVMKNKLLDLRSDSTWTLRPEYSCSRTCWWRNRRLWWSLWRVPQRCRGSPLSEPSEAPASLQTHLELVDGGTVSDVLGAVLCDYYHTSWTLNKTWWQVQKRWKLGQHHEFKNKYKKINFIKGNRGWCARLLEIFVQKLTS